MPLSVGDRLGPYEILAPLGKGGMGEVYRARDTRLGREVAIKVSNAEFTERSAREARSIAALNHTNICTLYDVGPNYLVMELIEGESPEGPLPLATALHYARQIADALEAAHEKGITHRDLKPANIKIKPDATVKVLDFGLAKVAPAFSGEPDADFSATFPLTMTQPGVVMGTPAYMSPEQARGQPVDKRADIWAFGVVLYEMLTGKRPFKGADLGETLAAVIKEEPRLEEIPAQVQPLLRRCLEKDPKKRLRDIGDAWQLLEHAPPVTAGHARPLPWIAATVAVTVAALVLGFGWWRAAHPADPPLKPLVRLDVDLGPGVALSSQDGADAVLSPDGTRLVYVSQARLFTRRLDQPKAAELSGTVGAYGPFFSPDGQWVGFFAQGKLKKVSVEGGAAISLCNAPAGAGGSWGEDGNIIAALTINAGLSRIPSTGGAPTLVTELAQGEISHRWPQILPDGQAVLFTANTGQNAWDGANIEVMSLTDRRRKTLQRGGTYGRYLATSKGAGYLSYINNGTLFAVPFDLDPLAVRGTPSPVLQGIAYSPQNGFAQFNFSGAPSGPGTLVYRSGGAAETKLLTVQWLDGAGKTQPLLAKPGHYVIPRLSPDGQRLALTVTEGSNSDIWIYEWQRDTMTRLTFGGFNNSPVWSPDGRYIVFEGRGGMFWTRSDGAGQPQPLTQSKNRQVPHSFAPDARRLAFFQFGGGGTDIWTLPMESGGSGLRAGKPEVFVQTPSQTRFVERHPSFSPDGRWLAYSSNESGSNQVYVRAFPDRGGKWQISSGGGLYLEWARNGRELFFRTDDNRIMVAAYTVKEDSFVADKPRVWSDKQLADAGVAGINYALAPDGKRIVALMPAEAPAQPQAQSHVIFLENFFDDLRRRVPAGK
jgi:Tol biopolymer transport system component